MKTAIITGGMLACDFISNYIQKEQLDYFIAADSGIHYFTETGRRPDEIVGDFDSANPKELEKLRQDTTVLFHKYPVEKDETDTELALRLALDRGSREVHILGAMGTRLDHMLGTIHLLGMALNEQVPCYMADANNRLQLLSRKTSLKQKDQYGKYVSLIPFTTEVTGLTMSGFRYPACNVTLGGFQTLGISNEIVDEEAVIDFATGILIEVEAHD